MANGGSSNNFGPASATDLSLGGSFDEEDDKLLITKIPNDVKLSDIEVSFGCHDVQAANPVKLISYPIRQGTALVKFHTASDRYKLLSKDSPSIRHSIKEFPVIIERFPVQIFEVVEADISRTVTSSLSNRLCNYITERTGLVFCKNTGSNAGLFLRGSWYRIESAHDLILKIIQSMSTPSHDVQVFGRITAFADPRLQFMTDDSDVLQKLSSKTGIELRLEEPNLIFHGSWDGMEYCYKVLEEQYKMYQHKVLEKTYQTSARYDEIEEVYHPEGNEIALVHKPSYFNRTPGTGNLDNQKPIVKTEVMIQLNKGDEEWREIQKQQSGGSTTEFQEASVSDQENNDSMESLRSQQEETYSSERKEKSNDTLKYEDAAIPENRSSSTKNEQIKSKDQIRQKSIGMLGDHFVNKNSKTTRNKDEEFGQNTHPRASTSSGRKLPEEQKFVLKNQKDIDQDKVPMATRLELLKQKHNAEIKPLKKECDKLRSDMDKVEQRLVDKDGEINYWKQELLDAKKETIQLEQQKNAVLQSLPNVRTDIDKLLNQLGDKDQEIKKLDQLLRYEKEQHDFSKQQCAKVNTEKVKLEQQLLNEKEEKDTVLQQLSYVGTDLDKLRNQLGDKDQEIKQFEQQLRNEKEEKNSVLQSLSNVKTDINMLRNQLDDKDQEIKKIDQLLNEKKELGLSKQPPKGTEGSGANATSQKDRNPTSEGEQNGKARKSKAIENKRKNNPNASENPNQRSSKSSLSSDSESYMDAQEEPGIPKSISSSANKEEEEVKNLSATTETVFASFKEASSANKESKTSQVQSETGSKQVLEEQSEKQQLELQLERIVLKYLRKKKKEQLKVIREQYDVTFDITDGYQYSSLTVLPGKGKRPRIQEGYDALIDIYQDVAYTTSQDKITVSQEDLKDNSKVEKIVKDSQATEILIYINDNVIEIMGPKGKIQKAMFDVKKALGHDMKTREEEENELESRKNKVDFRSNRQLSVPRESSSISPGNLNFTTIEGIKISVYKGDITLQTTHVIVNAANSRLHHGGGVAGAIAKVGGYKIQKDSDDLMKNRSYRPLDVSEAVYTTVPKPNKLKCRYIVHAVGPRWEKYPDKARCRDLLTRTFYNSLDTASSLKADSVTIPAISSGIFGVPRHICVECMFTALKSFSLDQGKKSTLKDVRFVNIDDETTNDIIAGFNKFLGYTSTNTYDPVKEPSLDMYRTSNQDYGRSSASYESITHSSGSSGGARSKTTSSTHWQPAPRPTPCVQCADGTPGKIPMDCNHWYCYSCKDYLAKDPTVRNCIKCTKSPERSTSVDDVKEEDKCVICLEKMIKPKKLDKCGHSFCTSCIDKWLKEARPQCPVCGVSYGKRRGDQPKGGEMTTFKYKLSSLPGYEGCGYTQITYDIPGGIQEQIHPSPGKSYRGVRWTAYLPNNKEGKEILGLLRKAFDARLIFTIGQSRTRGTEDVVTWNDIHHKTKINGGPFGYPDPGYLKRVREELADKGIK